MLAVQAALSKESKQLCIARGGIPATKAVAENGFPQWHYFEVYDRCDFPSVPNALTLEKR
jgi:hypothetical protein